MIKKCAYDIITYTPYINFNFFQKKVKTDQRKREFHLKNSWVIGNLNKSIRLIENEMGTFKIYGLH